MLLGNGKVCVENSNTGLAQYKTHLKAQSLLSSITGLLHL